MRNDLIWHSLFINNNWVFGIKSGIGSSLYYIGSLWLLIFEIFKLLKSELILPWGKTPATYTNLRCTKLSYD